jgi:hypothetical protein
LNTRRSRRERRAAGSSGGNESRISGVSWRFILDTQTAVSTDGEDGDGQIRVHPDFLTGEILRRAGTEAKTYCKSVYQ